MAIRRTRPVPIGGLTDMVLMRLGLASSSASAIQRWLTAASSAISSLSRRSMSALSSAASPEIEIEPPVAVADRPSRHRIRRHDREQMKGSMGAHPLVAPLPVDAGDHAHGQAGQGGPNGWHMENGRAIRVVDRIDDRKHCPVFQLERPLIAALSSALRIKDRPIERNAARFGQEHGRFRLGLIRVFAKERLCHCTNTSGAPPLASSQSGTGRFFERRKAGLNAPHLNSIFASVARNRLIRPPNLYYIVSLPHAA